MANCKLQTAVCSYAFAVYVAEISNFSNVFSSVQFSSFLFLFSQNTIHYKNQHIGIVRLQGSPAKTRRLMKPGFPSLKEISEIK